MNYIQTQELMDLHCEINRDPDVISTCFDSENGYITVKLRNICSRAGEPVINFELKIYPDRSFCYINRPVYYFMEPSFIRRLNLIHTVKERQMALSALYNKLCDKVKYCKLFDGGSYNYEDDFITINNPLYKIKIYKDKTFEYVHSVGIKDCRNYDKLLKNEDYDFLRFLADFGLTEIKPKDDPKQKLIELMKIISSDPLVSRTDHSNFDDFFTAVVCTYNKPVCQDYFILKIYADKMYEVIKTPRYLGANDFINYYSAFINNHKLIETKTDNAPLTDLYFDLIRDPDALYAFCADSNEYITVTVQNNLSALVLYVYQDRSFCYANTVGTITEPPIIRRLNLLERPLKNLTKLHNEILNDPLISGVTINPNGNFLTVTIDPYVLKIYEDKTYECIDIPKLLGRGVGRDWFVKVNDFISKYQLNKKTPTNLHKDKEKPSENEQLKEQVKSLSEELKNTKTEQFRHIGKLIAERYLNEIYFSYRILTHEELYELEIFPHYCPPNKRNPIITFSIFPDYTYSLIFTDIASKHSKETLEATVKINSIINHLLLTEKHIV